MNNTINSVCGICNYEYLAFLNKPNVIGIALGNKITNYIDTGESCIQVLVSKKIPKDFLLSNSLIDTSYCGIKTDVIEIGSPSPLSFNAKVRPMLFGYSIGPYNLKTSGTAGCLVTDGNKYFILSNNHIIAGKNSLPLGTPILQPSLKNGGVYPYDSIATLYKYAKINFETDYDSPVNYIDAALAYIKHPSHVSSNIAIVGKVKGIIEPFVSLPVQKIGRSTSLTTGDITGVNATVIVRYSNNKSALFKNQIITTYMGKHGDSGSLLLDYNNNAVGLLFAGSKNVTIHNPISTVLNLLNVKLVI